MADKTQRLLNKMRKQTPHLNRKIAGNLILPNNSGIEGFSNLKRIKNWYITNLFVDNVREKTAGHGVAFDNILYANAIGTGLDVLHSATIGNHLTVLNNLDVGGVLDIDHIAEKTAGHNIVFNNNLEVSGGSGATTRRIIFQNAGTFIGEVFDNELDIYTDNTFRVQIKDTGLAADVDIVPFRSGQYDLGDEGLKWKDLWLSGNATIGGDADIVGDATIGGQLTHNNDLNDPTTVPLLLKGFQPGSPLTSLGGHIAMYWNGTSVSGYVFSNLNRYFVFSNTVQNARDDPGNAWIRFTDGSCSFAGHKFVTDGNGDTYWVGAGAGLPYGSMYNDNTSTNVTIGTAGTFVRIPSGFSQGQVNLCTFGNAREITVLKAGKYKIDWSISAALTAGASDDVEGAIGIDNAKNAQGTAHRIVAAATDIGAFGGTAILDLSANQVVSLMVTNNTIAVDITVTHASLSLVQVGG